jgi:AcrR family transcriptional regulator
MPGRASRGLTIAIPVRPSDNPSVRLKSGTAVRGAPTFIEAARRAQILNAALETIADLGFMNASLAQIAKRAGISKSVIGYYFPSKDDLVRAAVDQFYVTGHTTMMGQIENVTTATEMLRLYVRTNVTYIDQNRVATRGIGEIIANFRTPDGQPVFRIEDAEPMVLGTAALFEWGQKTGEFRAFDTRVMAVLLRGAMDTFGQQLSANPELDAENFINEVTETFIRATRKES